MKKNIPIISISLVVVIIIVIILMPNGSSFETINNFEGEMTVYESPSCGCCGIYSEYFKSKGNNNVEVVSLNDLSQLKNQYGVPADLESCHTTIVGDYFVEGHIPLEAIEKLLSEKPDIVGIAMPGMPSGSPGMPGTKYSDFVIYAVEHDGGYYEYMRM